MPPQRVYLIGAGIIARSHANAAYALSVTEPISLAVTDINTQALDDFKKQYPQARLFPDVHSMLSEPPFDTDIVIVATPPVTHCELTCTALATGRHVLCEKPLAMDRVQAERMVEVARANKRLLGCCSVRMLDWPAAEEARHLLREGALGQVYHIRFFNCEQRNRPGIEYQPGTYWFLDKAKSGGGTLMDRAPYEFTVLNDLLQPTRVDVLNAWLANPSTALRLPSGVVDDVEQQAGATMRYYLSGGTTAILSYERASCTHGEERSFIEVEGLRGSVRWQWPRWGMKPTLTYSYDVDGMIESTVRSFPLPSASLSRFGEKPLSYFYQRVLGRPSAAVVNEQALFNFSCIRAIYDCAASGQVQTVVAKE